MNMSKTKPKKMAVGGLVGALMNKDKPGGMLGGVIPGVAGMLVRDRAKEDKEAAAKKAKAAKMAMGGKCRGMGAATKGGNYKG